MVVIYAQGDGEHNASREDRGCHGPRPHQYWWTTATWCSNGGRSIRFRPNATPSHPYLTPSSRPPCSRPLFVGLTPGQVGLYQINVKIPDTLPPIPACTGYSSSTLLGCVQSNLTIDIGGVSSFDGAAICIQPGQ